MNICRCFGTLCFVAGSVAVSDVSRADILIALAAPMSGSEATVGKQMGVGAQKAVDDLNLNSGVLGEKIVLQVTDDACDRKQAVAAANQLANQAPALVLGHHCLQDSMAASAIYDKEKILQISLNSTNVDFLQTSPSAGIFRICALDPALGPAGGISNVAGKYLATLTTKKVAILSDNSPYGSSLVTGVVTAMNAAGHKPDIETTFVPGKPNYTSDINDLKSAKIDFVYLAGRYPMLGELAKEIRATMPNVVLLAEDAIASKDYWSRPENLADDPRLAKIPFEDLAYAAVQIWAEAVQKASSFERDAVVKALNHNRFPTVLGYLTFKQKGDLSDVYYASYQQVKSIAHPLVECQ